MKVKELIEHLQTKDQNATVVYSPEFEDGITADINYSLDGEFKDPLGNTHRLVVLLDGPPKEKSRIIIPGVSR